MSLTLFGTPTQKDIIFCPYETRFIGFFAGRRWGKTFTARNRILNVCLSEPNINYAYVAPFYAQVEAEYDALVFHPDLQTYIARAKTQPFPQIWFRNGSHIQYRCFNSNPRSLRSKGLNELWMDEIQDVAEQDFWPVVRPLISDRKGRLIVSGQFRGLNWYHKEFFEKGQDTKNHPLYRSWRYPSSTGIAFSSDSGREELELVKSQIPKAIYEQEYECIPTSNQASVFPADLLKRIELGNKVEKARENYRYVAGLDIGRVRDPSAIDVLEVETGLVVHSETFAHGEEHSMQALRAAAICKRYNDCPCVIDSTGGATGGHTAQDSFVNFYRQRIKNLHEFVWTAGNKGKIIAELSLNIEQQLINIPPEFKDLHSELQAYEYKYRNGIYHYSAPTGKHDDHVAALAQAVWGRKCGYAGNGNYGTFRGSF